jgi:hypothetical protein
MGESRVVVTATEEIWIDREPEAVFDYTQDYSRRMEWDAGISKAAIIADAPRTARVTVPGLGSMSVVYRLDRRPERTSAAFEDVDSRWITGGGGSWQYEPVERGTKWRQVNTLELRPGLLSRLLAPVLRRNLRRSMRRAMAEAKRRLEAGP